MSKDDETLPARAAGEEWDEREVAALSRQPREAKVTLTFATPRGKEATLFFGSPVAAKRWLAKICAGGCDPDPETPYAYWAPRQATYFDAFSRPVTEKIFAWAFLRETLDRALVARWLALSVWTQTNDAG